MTAESIAVLGAESLGEAAFVRGAMESGGTFRPLGRGRFSLGPEPHAVEVDCRFAGGMFCARTKGGEISVSGRTECWEPWQMAQLGRDFGARVYEVAGRNAALA